MATRASITLKENGKTVAAVYKHWDGYIKGGLGDTLTDIIQGGKLVDGLGPESELGKVFNGTGCLFASIIALLKRTPGDVYLVAPEDVGHQGEDYLYTIEVVDPGYDGGIIITLEVEDVDREIKTQYASWNY